MNKNLKIAAYVVLGALALWLGTLFVGSLRKTLSPTPPPKSTNDVAAATTNIVAGTNAAAVATNIFSSNAVATATNIVPAAANAEPSSVESDASAPTEVRVFDARRVQKILFYGAGLLVVVVGLGLLISHDVSQAVAHKVGDLIFNDNLEGVRNPEYEHAEQVWADGKHLEAIQLMRDFLKVHPREQYVALRIAEIYEKDLRNYLAAALEYEEILKKPLPPERWGWAAVRLVNLYSGKLNKGHQAEALLHRIVNDYGQTAAAKKARERLGIPEPVQEAPPETAPAERPRVASLEEQMAELHAELQQMAPPEEPEPPEEPPPTDDKPGSKLPPGFRPKGS